MSALELNQAYLASIGARQRKPLEEMLKRIPELVRPTLKKSATGNDIRIILTTFITANPNMNLCPEDYVVAPAPTPVGAPAPANASAEALANVKPVKEKKAPVRRAMKPFVPISDRTYLRVATPRVLDIVRDIATPRKTKILDIIKNAHNALYTAENISGSDALNDIMNLIFLRCIQPLLSEHPAPGKIDLLNAKYYVGDTHKDVSRYFRDVMSICGLNHKDIRHPNIGKDDTDIIMQMGCVLVVHETTRQMFTESNFMRCKSGNTVKKLLEIVGGISVDELMEGEDIIGEIYEHIVNGYTKKGSKLGQFFTPRILMNVALEYSKKSILNLYEQETKEGTTLEVGDLCMGTAGWLVSTYNVFKRNHGDSALISISGIDVEPTTYKYGLMNLCLTLHKMPDMSRVWCGSSLSHIDGSKKYNLIVTNPPFQTSKKLGDVKKNFVEDEVSKKTGVNFDEVFVVGNNSPPIQFIDRAIYSLKDGGMCIIVLPYGNDITGLSGMTARKSIMNRVNITTIILNPCGIFTHTDIKTCTLIFKKEQCNDKKIDFLEMSKTPLTLTHITTVSQEDILRHPHASWGVKDYLKDEEKKQDESIQMIPFGELFTLEKGTLQSSKVIEDPNGDGVLVNWSTKAAYKRISNPTLEGNNLFISTSMPNGGEYGCYVVISFISGKCSYCNLLSRAIPINPNHIDVKFAYYYLKSIKQKIEEDYQKGSCNKSLDVDKLNIHHIPVPSVEVQKEIVEYLDFLLETSEKTSLQKIVELKKSNEFIMKHHIKRGGYPTKRLEEICEIKIGGTPSRSNPEYYVNGIHPWVSVKQLNGGIIRTTEEMLTDLGVSKSSVKLFQIGTVLFSFKLSIGKTGIAGVPMYSNEAIAGINSHDFHILINEFLYYYLTVRDFSDTGSGAISNGSLNTASVSDIEIPVPPLEVQEKIVIECQENDDLIAKLESQIAQNKIRAREYLNSIIN